jgi:hypothetical protein
MAPALPVPLHDPASSLVTGKLPQLVKVTDPMAPVFRSSAFPFFFFFTGLQWRMMTSHTLPRLLVPGTLPIGRRAMTADTDHEQIAKLVG